MELALGMLMKLALFCLVVITAVLSFSPVVQSGNEIHILFDVDLLLLLFTGEGDPTVLTTRYIDWYPDIGVSRIVASVVLAVVAVFLSWKVKDPDPAPGTMEAGRRAERLVDGGALEVLDDPADGETLAAGTETAPVLLLPDRSRAPAVVSSPAAGEDVPGTKHEPSDHPRRRDRGAGRLHEAVREGQACERGSERGSGLRYCIIQSEGQACVIALLDTSEGQACVIALLDT